MDAEFDEEDSSGAELLGRPNVGTVLHRSVAAHRSGTAPASAAFAPSAYILASLLIMTNLNPRSAASRAAGPEPTAVPLGRPCAIAAARNRSMYPWKPGSAAGRPVDRPR